MSLPRAFASDNTAPVHPAVLARLAQVNQHHAPAYGNDDYTREATQWLADQCGGGDAFLVWNGTGANVLALRAMTRPWQAIVCAEQAHINLDECGAPELATGCKLVDITTPDGKLRPADVRAAHVNIGVEHAVQPRVVSITQSTEFGTVYGIDELRALCDMAHGCGMLVHMDGARIANACASLGVSARAMTRDAGVDVVSFGITKAGAMGVEAVVFFDPALAADFRYLRKQSAQLSSKMRYLAAQVLAMADGDLWLANARHANAMARRLADRVAHIGGVRILHPVQSSAVFAMLPVGVTERLQRDFHFYVWNEATGEVRWMTNWATDEADVDEFAAAIEGESSRVGR
jgi:threonine aldolase